jgi:hypothetical protein
MVKGGGGTKYEKTNDRTVAFDSFGWIILNLLS